MPWAGAPVDPSRRLPCLCRGRGSPWGRRADRVVAARMLAAEQTRGQKMSRLDGGERTIAGGVQAGTRVVLVVFAVFTLLAANVLVVFTARTDRYFAWTIHDEPTAAFLGAAYAAGFVLSVLALRQDRWSHLRVALVTVTAFTVLTSTATIAH